MWSPEVDAEAPGRPGSTADVTVDVPAKPFPRRINLSVPLIRSRQLDRKKNTMPEDTPVSPISYTLSGGYPYVKQTYPLYQMTMEPPLTEERIRQILREELAAYFDEGKDVLAAPTKQEDYPFFALQKELYEALLAVGTLNDDPLSEQDRLEHEQRLLATFPEDDTLS